MRGGPAAKVHSTGPKNDHDNKRGNYKGVPDLLQTSEITSNNRTID